MKCMLELLLVIIFFVGATSASAGDCGDVYNDGSINILDAVFLINYKYKSGPAPEDLLTADVNGDGEIDILDVVYLINYKYKSGPEPNCPVPAVTCPDPYLYLIIHSHLPVKDFN